MFPQYTQSLEEYKTWLEEQIMYFKHEHKAVKKAIAFQEKRLDLVGKQPSIIMDEFIKEGDKPPYYFDFSISGTRKKEKQCEKERQINLKCQKYVPEKK